MSNESSPSRRRVIGRILALGFPLPGPQVDNYNVISAPAFFDYDALVIDPSAISTLIESVARGDAEASTFTGSRVRVSPERPTDVALADILDRRRQETQRLLDNGGAVLCFLHPETWHRISEADPMRDYEWLPREIQAQIVAATEPSEGTQAHVVDHHHPLAAFVGGQAANLAYRAYIDQQRMPDCHVFARSQGGAAIAVEVPVPSGRVILLPALRALPSGDARYTMSDAMQSGIRRALGAIAEGRPPLWLAGHPLQGLAERHAELDAGRAELDAAQARYDATLAAHEELARYQRLLWQEGSLGLEDVVIDGLKLIACDVYAARRDEFEMRIDNENVLFEVEASERPIDLAAHHRLRQRIEQAIERRGSAPRGVLFVNGERLSDPVSREHEVSDALRLASETMRYCIAPTSTLYAAVAAKLAGDDATVAAYRRSLVDTDGVIPHS